MKNIFSVKERVPSEFFNQPYVDKGRKEKGAGANRNPNRNLGEKQPGWYQGCGEGTPQGLQLDFVLPGCTG